MIDAPSPVREGAPPVTITYADDQANRMIYWRCESEACPSRITTPDGPTPFVGQIQYAEGDRTHGYTLLGAIAVAHATLLDQAPLEAMTLGSILEQEEEQHGDS